MSLPHEDTARASLPVVNGCGDDSALMWAILDRAYLEREGIIIEDPGIHLADSVELVAGLGLAGVYSDHVRATGRVYRCPPWCQAVDHPRVGIIDQSSPEPGHVAAGYELRTPVGIETQECRVQVEHWPDEGPPAVVLYADGCDLTAERARQVAAALLNAADTLDRIGGQS